jgi:hypothetical protein
MAVHACERHLLLACGVYTCLLEHVLSALTNIHYQQCPWTAHSALETAKNGPFPQRPPPPPPCDLQPCHVTERIATVFVALPYTAAHLVDLPPVVIFVLRCLCQCVCAGAPSAASAATPLDCTSPHPPMTNLCHHKAEASIYYRLDKRQHAQPPPPCF